MPLPCLAEPRRGWKPRGTARSDYERAKGQHTGDARQKQTPDDRDRPPWPGPRGRGLEPRRSFLTAWQLQFVGQQRARRDAAVPGGQGPRARGVQSQLEIAAELAQSLVAMIGL